MSRLLLIVIKKQMTHAKSTPNSYDDINEYIQQNDKRDAILPIYLH